MATEFVEVFADSSSIERATIVGDELLVLATALLRVGFFACPVFLPLAGVAPRAAAELRVDVFAVLVFFSFVRIETGLRAFVIAFDRS